MKAQKEKLRVVIFASHHEIRGDVHLYENSRLTDILNADAVTKDFLPVTNATILDKRTEKSLHVGFLSINRRHIQIVMEDDEAIAISRTKELLAKRKYTEAMELAQRAVKALPDNPEAHYLLGFCLAKNGEVEKARKSFEKSLKLKPDDEILHQAQNMLGTLA